MNILLVAPQPFYEERGTPIAVRLLAETLCGMGHRVDLLVYHEGQDILVPGLTLIRAGRPPGVSKVPIGISIAKLICDVWLVQRMIGLLRRKRYDVLHAVEEAIFPAALLRGYGRYRLVYDMDSSLCDQLTDKWRWLRPLRGTLELIERVTVRRCSAVLAVCEDLAVKVRPWTAAGRVVVLPDVPLGDMAADTPVESLRGGGSGADVIGLYVGNLERYQGIDLLLESLALLPAHSPLHMIVIGGAEVHLRTYRERAVELGIAARISFLGPRPLQLLGAYLQQADILVSPRTLGQNTPMKVYSYMQSGKAILATDIRSHTQALDPDCAELVAPQPAAVAAGLGRLAADTQLRERLGAAARHKAEREYSLPVYRRKLQQIYAQLAAG
jgi:glycosyltransferase involved in cell wall biosynthesis